MPIRITAAMIALAVCAGGRGKIDILNRDGLIKTACECYLAAERRFDGLFST